MRFEEFSQPMDDMENPQMPFYLPYPILLPFEQESMQDKDWKKMQSYYSKRAMRIQEKVNRECDRMEYDGSMMFDEYPDKFMMEHLCRKIEKEMQEEMKQEEMNGGETSVARRMEMQTMSRNQDTGLQDLIGVILFNEMYRRRCRRRQRRRFW